MIKEILTARRAGRSESDGTSELRQDVPDGTAVHQAVQALALDRRQLLTRAAVLGLVVAAPTPLQRFWALDQTMVPGHQKFVNWAAAMEPVTQNWLVWVQGPGSVGAPFYKVAAARTVPELVEGGHWQMTFDAQLRHDYGPSSMIRYIEAELSELSGAPAKVTSVNGTRIDA